MVERSIAWLIGPKNRCRQLRYRGVRKNNQWLQLRMTALNPRRMINLGLQPTANGSWIIPGHRLNHRHHGTATPQAMAT